MESGTSSAWMPGGWSWPDSRPTQRNRHQSQPQSNPASSTATDPPQPTRAQPPPTGAQSAQGQPKRKTWKPRQCRICLDTVLPTYPEPSENLPGFLQGTPNVTYEDENGRLIRPCKCKGSSKYVHEACLQAWRHADPSYGNRNFYNCPTCGFKYRLSRLGWGRVITSAAAQIMLTLLIFITVIFVLGFISDAVIDFCLDPWGSVWRGVTFQRQEYYYDYDDHPETWFEHFGKGFASLGLLSFFKSMLAYPVRFWVNSGGRGRNTGRDRIQGVTWLVVIIGALTFIFTVWKGVRHWSRRTLERAGERVVDVQGDDDGDDDDGV